MNALSPSPEPFQPHGLVGLWDMLEIYGAKFVSAIQALVTIEAFLLSADEKLMSALVDDESWSENISVLIVSCVAVGAKYTAKAAFRLQQSIEDKKCTYLDASRELRNIRDRLRDELQDAKLFGIHSDAAKYYDYAAPELIQNAFPRSCYDLEEASKCIAFDRSTAAVLHLMRGLEQPLETMAKSIGVNPKENWNSILNDIENAVRGKDREGNRTKYWEGRKEEHSFFAEACTHFFHIKNAWRNYASHAVKEKYTLDEAKKIYLHVTSFCEHLSSRLRYEDVA